MKISFNPNSKYTFSANKNFINGKNETSISQKDGIKNKEALEVVLIKPFEDVKLTTPKYMYSNPDLILVHGDKNDNFKINNLEDAYILLGNNFDDDQVVFPRDFKMGERKY